MTCRPTSHIFRLPSPVSHLLSPVPCLPSHVSCPKSHIPSSTLISPLEMVIAVNTRLLMSGKLEGIGWFTHEVLRHMVAAHPEHEFHFIFDRPFEPAFRFGSNVTMHVLHPPTRHPWLWYLWFEWRMPALLRRIGADVFFSPEGYCSLRSKVPTVMAIHDLSILHHPEHVKRSYLRYFQRYYPRFAARAERIVTVSEFSARDIEALLPEAKGKVQVVYNGARAEYRPLSGEEQESIRQQWSDGQPYLLYVGALQPRKNIERMLHAFERFKIETGAPHLLLLAGRKAWKAGPIETTWQQMQHRDAVHFLGYREVEELANLAGAAHAMVYVSLFEGFGIPILESLQCGVPVIASETTSMPEVTGPAGLLVDPYSVDEIASAMARIVTDQTLYTRLKHEALPQAAQFSWPQTAGKVWEVIESLSVARRLRTE